MHPLLSPAIPPAGGGLASAFKPRLRLRQDPRSGMVPLMVADVARLPQVTHAGLAARDPTCRPPLQEVVSPQSVELSAGTKGSNKQRMVEKSFGLVQSPHTTPIITHGVLILAPAGSRGAQERLDYHFGKRTLPVGSKGRRCNRRGLASAFKPCLGLRQGPASGLVLLIEALPREIRRVIPLYTA